MKRLISIGVVSAILSSAQAQAVVSDEEFSQLKADFTALVQRLNILEAENTTLRTVSESTATKLELAQTDIATVKNSKPSSSWADNIELKGDFRYRYEEIDLEGADKRDRSRIRARAEIVAKLPPNVDVGLGIASGGDNPISSNQTLGGGGSSKDLKLDLAYAKWNITPDLYLTAGKYKNIFYRPQKSGLLWDGDYRPEGVAMGWSNDSLFVVASGNWLESDSKKSNQEIVYGLQGGVKLALGGAALTAGVGYYDIPAKGNSAFDGDGSNFFGNSRVCDDLSDLDSCVYQFDYEELEVFANLALTVFDKPLNVYIDYVQNQAADDFDTGWIAGAHLGKAKGKGTWQLGYQYQDLEKDAVLGLISDSNFAGGGTDGKGHRLSGAYGVSKSWNLGLTWFIDNEAGEGNLGSPLTYDRIVLDAKFKY
jgi:hypothetical protein